MPEDNLTPEEIKKITSKARFNRTLLDTCYGHEFAELPKDQERIGLQYRCERCRGLISAEAFTWYQLGFKHGKDIQIKPLSEYSKNDR